MYIIIWIDSQKHLAPSFPKQLYPITVSKHTICSSKIIGYWPSPQGWVQPKRQTQATSGLWSKHLRCNEAFEAETWEDNQFRLYNLGLSFQALSIFHKDSSQSIGSSNRIQVSEPSNNQIMTNIHIILLPILDATMSLQFAYWIWAAKEDWIRYSDRYGASLHIIIFSWWWR